MRIVLVLSLLVLLYSCKSTSYFVVRHAEKHAATNMVNDVPLSEQGKERAEALKSALISEHIRAIYSTKFSRTISTAEPLAQALKLPIQSYDPNDTIFIQLLRNKKENVLIVGHSNTVDNIVNTIIGSNVISGDLPETQYGDLFVVTRKGKHYSFQRRHFGK